MKPHWIDFPKIVSFFSGLEKKKTNVHSRGSTSTHCACYYTRRHNKPMLQYGKEERAVATCPGTTFTSRQHPVYSRAGRA